MERAEDRCRKTERQSPNNVINVDSPECIAELNAMPRCPPPEIPKRPFCRSKRARLALQRIQVKKEEYEQGCRARFSAATVSQSKRDVSNIGSPLALDVLEKKNNASNTIEHSKRPTSFGLAVPDGLPPSRKEAPWLSQNSPSKPVRASKADEPLHRKQIDLSHIRPLDAHSDVSKDKILMLTAEGNSPNALTQSDIQSKDSESSWSPPSEDSDLEFFVDKNLRPTTEAVCTRRSNMEKAMADLHDGSSEEADLEKNNPVRRRWTREEELTLLRSIEAHGRQWDKVAQDVKTRTPNQCLMRWYRIRPWVSEEENIVFESSNGKINASLRETQKKVRTVNCRKNASTSISKSATHNKRWSPKEEHLFVESLKRYGTNNWDAIARDIGTRTVEQCRKKYANTRYSLKKKFESPKW